MGENEQSGMLRSVVVLGIIAIISFVVIAGVVALKVNMKNNTDEAIPPVMIMSVLDKSDFKFTTHDGNDQPGPTLNDNVVDWTSSDGVHLDTTSLPDKTWVVGYSPKVNIPRGTKRVKFTVTLKGTGTQYVHPRLHINTSAGNKNYYLETISGSHQVPNYTVFSKIFTVPDGEGSFTATIESREGMNISFKDMTVTLYNN